MTPTNENARRQPGAVIQFSPDGTGKGDCNAICKNCGARFRRFSLCITCWRWTLSAQHNRAAVALLRGLT